jgi:4-hydroxy-4-methyl-2-oxoglutarate aldolase
MKMQTDAELFSLIQDRLTTPLIGDILDPVRIADCTGPQPRPFGKLTDALDALQPGEIYVATGGSMRCAAWGEIMTATARTRGAAGAVIDGFHRDTPKVLDQNWPVFSRGSFAQDAGVRSTVIDFRCTVEIGGVLIEPGDLVFGDLDGVVVIPRSIEAKVVEAALEKKAGEKIVRNEIEAGSTSTAVFNRYGIL